ncbi:MAG: polysaccharide biosynthesis C-terminal domain-containing protein [Methylotetracoccus sp.]
MRQTEPHDLNRNRPIVNPIRSLVSQTAIYGVSSIVGRFLNYLLVPLYTYYFSTGEYGVVSELYAYAGFFAVVLAFGLETGYFRFRRQDEDAEKVYGTALSFVLVANLVFVLAIVLGLEPLAALLRYSEHPEYLLWFALMLGCDGLSSLPFARLRAENRAGRFAAIKIAEILVTIALNLFFIVYCRRQYQIAPDSWVAQVYDPSIGVGYIFISNLIASVFKLALLSPQLLGLAAGVDFSLLKRLLGYSLPMVVIGLAGIVNEMLDRAVLKFLLPYDLDTNLQMLGIYGACYKLSILMSLFIQAFRYAGEPFFFAYSGNHDAKRIYATVLRYFVIFCVFVFLLVSLYLDVFQYFIGPRFRVGLPVVPILLLANLFLGIYVNLSVWYKLTDRTLLGAWVALCGAVLTVVLNIWWVPSYGYVGSAWAHLVCYSGMTVASYLLGRRYYPVDYRMRTITAYVAFGLVLYFGNAELLHVTGWHPLLTGTGFLATYLMAVLLLEGEALGLRSVSRRRAR